MIEMIPSVNKWGTEYFDMPPVGATKAGSYLRILSAEDGNMISRNGSTFQLDRGKKYDISQSLSPTHIRSLNHKKFIVMRYHYSSGAFGSQNVTDASMSVLVPLHNFENRVLTHFPLMASDSAATYYTTWISTKTALNGIALSTTGRAGQSLTSLGGSGTFNFPGSDYWATRLRVGNQQLAYFATGDEKFSVELSPVSELQTYALPGSMGLRTMSADTTAPSLAVTPLNCGKYVFHASDADGIALVDLVFDTSGSSLSSPSINYDIALDPAYMVGASNVAFTAHPIDSNKSGVAAVRVIDKSGNASYYFAAHVPTVPSITTNTPSLGISGRVYDTIRIPITIHNQTNEDWDNVLISISADSMTFEMTEAPPTSIPALDSVQIAVRFSPQDIDWHTAHVHATMECNTASIELRGRGMAPLIVASDLDLDTISVGVEECGEVRVENISGVDLSITGVIADPGLRVDALSFPIILQANTSVTLPVCLRLASAEDYRGVIRFTIDSDWPQMKDSSIVSAMARPSLGVANEPSSTVGSYPNPASTTLFLLNLPDDRTLTYSILDMLGVSMSTGSVVTDAKGCAAVSLSSLGNGTYVLRLQEGQVAYAHRFVIKR